MVNLSKNLLNKYIQRCQGVMQTRGLIGFFKFISSRIVRFSGDLVFEKSLDKNNVQIQKKPDITYQVFVIDASNMKNQENIWLVQSILRGENREYLEGLQKKDCMIAITSDSTVVHTSFVQFETSYKKLLNEDNLTPLIGNCWTSQKHRGKGLYPYAIANCCKKMASRGCLRIVISCAPENTPSIAGIKKAGFVKIREVRTLSIMTKIYFQKITSQHKFKNKYKIAIL